MPLTLVEEGKDFLYRYISRQEFQKRIGFYFPDPLIEEFTYGEGAFYSPFIWRNINTGSRVFFHTRIGGTRYLTAMYWVADFAPAAVWRADNRMRSRYRNPHLHPEKYPEFWGDDAASRQRDQEVSVAYANGTIFIDVDMVLIGDPRRSFDIRKSPVILNREVMGRLDMQGKPVKWDIVNRKGEPFHEDRCISACLRVPRVLSKSDGDFLESLVSKAAGVVRREQSYAHISAIDPFVASEIQLSCATEEEIESLVIKKLRALEAGLRYVARQVRLDGGNRIDILAERKTGDPVVIEIKKGTADDSTLTQLISYLHQYKKEHPERDPVGKIVCADASYRLRTACEHLGIHVHCYGDILLRD